MSVEHLAPGIAKTSAYAIVKISNAFINDAVRSQLFVLRVRGTHRFFLAFGRHGNPSQEKQVK
jgi:hypothetical protein